MRTRVEGPTSIRRVAARWGLAALAAVLPSGLGAIPLLALWVAGAGAEGWGSVAPAAGLTLIAVIGNVILYAGL